jgi:hypothetical protein
MLVKLLWFSAIFLITVGIIFLASFGFEVPVTYYEKSEIVMADNKDIGVSRLQLPPVND